MKPSLLKYMLLAVLGLGACQTDHKPMQGNQAMDTPSADTAEMPVPYSIARNYFVKNDFEPSLASNWVMPDITEQSEFEKIFGMATTMGENGKPTEIDFSKQYVIAIIDPITNLASEYQIKGLKLKSNTLHLDYSLIQGEKMTSTMQPCLILVIDKKYQYPLNVLKGE